MSEYDALRKVIEHEANQDDDGGFFAQLGGLEPDPEDDGPTARGLFQHMDLNRNSHAYRHDPKVMPKKSAIDYLLNAFKSPFKPKRRPYMIIRRLSSYGGDFGTHRVWCVHCTKCEIPGTKKPLIFAKTSTWKEAITTATHHAHNHH